MNFRLEQKGNFFDVILETVLPARDDKPSRPLWFRIFDRDVEQVLGKQAVEVLHLWRETKAEQAEKVRVDSEKRARAQQASGGRPVRSVGKTERDRMKKQGKRPVPVPPPKLEG